ncbi:MAG: hypothetical protein OEM07_00640 [Gammaproteobacteria bacterium]|nr:hypothetical protein [Gammaproteobacteria bacterium]
MSKSFSSYIHLAASLLAGLVLSACSAGNNKLPVLDENAVSVAGGFVSASRTQGVRADKIKKLVIPAFNVTYRLKAEDNVVSVSENGLDKVTTHIKVNVEDADVAMMQALTNKAYKVFVAELEKAKFEVVALDEVSKSDAYYQVNHKNLSTSVSIDDKDVTLVPDGLKYYDPNDKMDPDGSFLMGVANINSAVNGDLVEEFGGEKDGVASLSVNMSVQFGNFDLEDHRVSPAIDFNPSFTVLGGDTDMSVTTEFKAVSMPGRVFYIPEESGVYSLNQDMGSKTNVISAMLEVGSKEGEEEYNATINAEYFERAGLEQIQRVSQLLVQAVTGTN